MIKARKFVWAVVAVCAVACGASWADSGMEWSFALDAGSTTQGVLTSGDWQLRAALTKAGGDSLSLGTGSWAEATAYVAGGGVLDLTMPIVQEGGGNLTLTAVSQTAFMKLPNHVRISRIVLPETVTAIGKYAFSDVTSVDKILVRAAGVSTLGMRAFFGVSNLRRLELTLPLGAQVGDQVGSNGGVKQQLVLDLSNLGEIPTNMLGGVSFSNLVLKTSLAQKMKFRAFPYRDGYSVSLTGDCPDLSARGATADTCIFGDEWTPKGKMLLRIPFGNATYDAWRVAAVARPLSEAERADFARRYPDEAEPIGWLPGTLGGTWNDQVLVEFNPLTVAGTVVVSSATDAAGRTVCGLDDGETFVFGQPETFVAEGVKWRTVGGTVWHPAPDAAGWREDASFEGNSYAFVQRGDTGARLDWRQEKVGFAAPSVTTDSAVYPESVTAVPDHEADADGFYPVGTTWTLTVGGCRTELPKSRFVRWVGDVPAGRETDIPLAVTPTNGTCSIRAEIRRDWLLAGEADAEGGKILTDGVWKLRATVEQGRVTIGKNWTEQGGLLEGPSTPTPLDFTGALTDAAGQALALHAIGNVAFKEAANVASVRVDSETLKWLGAEAFYGLSNMGDLRLVVPACESVGYQCCAANPNLTNLVLCADSLTSCAPSQPYRPFASNEKLVCAEIRAPKLTSLSERFLEKAPLSETDFTTWDLSSVRRIGPNAFKDCWLTADLAFPALREVAAEAFYNAKMQEIVLGTKHLTNICANAFRWCGTLRSVTLGNAAGLLVDEAAFQGSPPQNAGAAAVPTSVTFLGPAPDAAVIDRVIAAVPEQAGAKVCRIYASAGRNRRDGGPNWRNLATAPVGEEEIAASEAEAARLATEARGFLGGGVYRDGSRKAWLIGITTPYDERGLAVIIR